MGISRNAYVGPYLSAKIAVKKTEVDYCKSHNCSLDMDYCPKCGTHKQNRIRILELIDAPDDWGIEYPKGEFSNFMYSTSIMTDATTIDGFKTYTYLPNRYYDEIGIPSIEEGETVLDFGEMNSKEMVKKFKTLFADEIAYLSQWFEVKICFGLVSYYS
jgi:hypothetical protein